MTYKKRKVRNRTRGGEGPANIEIIEKVDCYKILKDDISLDKVIDAGKELEKYCKQNLKPNKKCDIKYKEVYKIIEIANNKLNYANIRLNRLKLVNEYGKPFINAGNIYGIGSRAKKSTGKFVKSSVSTAASGLGSAAVLPATGIVLASRRLGFSKRGTQGKTDTPEGVSKPRPKTKVEKIFRRSLKAANGLGKLGRHVGNKISKKAMSNANRVENTVASATRRRITPKGGANANNTKKNGNANDDKYSECKDPGDLLDKIYRCKIEIQIIKKKLNGEDMNYDDSNGVGTNEETEEDINYINDINNINDNINDINVNQISGGSTNGKCNKYFKNIISSLEICEAKFDRAQILVENVIDAIGANKKKSSSDDPVSENDLKTILDRENAEKGNEVNGNKKNNAEKVNEVKGNEGNEVKVNEGKGNEGNEVKVNEGNGNKKNNAEKVNAENGNKKNNAEKVNEGNGNKKNNAEKVNEGKGNEGNEVKVNEGNEVKVNEGNGNKKNNAEKGNEGNEGNKKNNAEKGNEGNKKNNAEKGNEVKGNAANATQVNKKQGNS